jgi:hypothetical protein
MTNQASAARPRSLQPLLSIRRASGLVLTGNSSIIGKGRFADQPSRIVTSAATRFLRNIMARTHGVSLWDQTRAL